MKERSRKEGGSWKEQKIMDERRMKEGLRKYEWKMNEIWMKN